VRENKTMAKMGSIDAKKCTKCDKIKNFSEFPVCIYLKDKHLSICKECMKLYRKKYRKSIKYRYSRYKKSAIERGFSFQLTLEEFKNLTKLECFYCGRTDSLRGVDRINSTKGYSIDNCVSCCTCCNRMKLDYTSSVFFYQIELIYKKHIKNETEAKKNG